MSLLFRTIETQILFELKRPGNTQTHKQNALNIPWLYSSLSNENVRREIELTSETVLRAGANNIQRRMILSLDDRNEKHYRFGGKHNSIWVRWCIIFCVTTLWCDIMCAWEPIFIARENFMLFIGLIVVLQIVFNHSQFVLCVINAPRISKY